MQIDRRSVQNFDWLTLGLVLAISLIGVMTIYSATRPGIEGQPHPVFFIKQLIWILLGLILLFVVVKPDYQWFARLSWIFYGIGIILLLFVLVKGRVGMGAQRWVSIGGFSFQPSELFRISFVLILAAYLSRIRPPIRTLTFMKMLPLLALLPIGLLVEQPDLGTASTMAGVFMLACALRRFERKLLVVIAIVGLISLPFFWDLVWHEFLHDYQRNRIIAFMDTSVDPAGIGYHINQSKIAIGSGMVFGKGFMHGTQGPFRFLPEKHTDFIFSVFAEEWGMAGSLFLLVLYGLFFYRALDTARQAKDEFGYFLALIITVMFAIYFFFNIGMTMGMMPVVGIPMPFMSYGGTAVLSNYIAVGLLINVRLRRFELFY
jgi:rod shape determining protein RodA